jgi:hypothetical protein
MEAAGHRARELKAKGALAMKHTVSTSLTLAALVCALTAMADAQQAPLPTTPSQIPGPPPGTAMTKAYVQMVGGMAYLWGWPLVNGANRAAAASKLPEPGLIAGMMPMGYNRVASLTGYIAPGERFVTCPNQDVVYSAGYFDLSKEPIVR